MTAITAGVVRPETNIEQKQLGYAGATAATKIVKGAITCVDTATGRAVNGTDTAGLVFKGMAKETYDNTSGAADAMTVEFEWGHAVDIATSGISAADEGKTVTVVDNNTVGLAANTTNDVKVGELEKYLGSNVGRVRLRQYPAV